MNSSQLLLGKRALVFGAGGSVGTAVAREFAAEGAEVFLSGRNQVRLEEVKRCIEEAGGRAHARAVDALDETAVQTYVDSVMERAGGVDIVFNVIGPKATEYGTAKHALDLTIDEYMVALSTVVKSCIITARSAARHMVKQHSGVIIGLTGSPARATSRVRRPSAQLSGRSRHFWKIWRSNLGLKASEWSVFGLRPMPIAMPFAPRPGRRMCPKSNGPLGWRT